MQSDPAARMFERRQCLPNLLMSPAPANLGFSSLSLFKLLSTAKTKCRTFRGLLVSLVYSVLLTSVPGILAFAAADSALYDVPGGFRAVMFDRFSGVQPNVSMCNRNDKDVTTGALGRGRLPKEGGGR